MTLPLSRNRSRSAADPVASADANDWDDMIIGSRHGSKVITFGVGKGWSTSGAPVNQSNGWAGSGGSDDVNVDIDLPVGTVITNIKVYVYQASATPVTWQLRSMSAAGSLTNEESNAGNATTGNKELEQAASITIVDDKSYRLRWQSTVALDRLTFFALTIQK